MSAEFRVPPSGPPSSVSAAPSVPAGEPAHAPVAGRFRRHELKYVVSREEAERLRDFAATLLRPDEFGGRDGRYLVHSLYFDSPALDVYHRTSGVEGVKYRVRRYGEEDVVWLERKRRKGTLVEKRRAAWPLAKLAEVLEPRRVFADWPGEFRRDLDRFKLAPKLLVSYPRTAFAGEGEARLTLDWGVAARHARASRPFSCDSEPFRVGDDVVVELKYCDELPAAFLRIMKLLGRDAGSFSKYGRAVEASGLVVQAKSRAAGSA
jgi:hypothetical protein